VSLQVYAFVRLEFQRTLELGGMLVDLGERQHSPELLSMGHRMVSSSLFSWGQPRAAAEHAEHAMGSIPLEPEQLRRLATRQGMEPRSVTLAMMSVMYSVLGEPDTARRYAREAVEWSERVAHPQTRAFVLLYLAMGCRLRQELRDALAWADRSVAFSREHGDEMLRSYAALIQGWCLSGVGRSQEGLVLIRREIDHWRSLGFRSMLPSQLHMLAQSLLGLGRVQEGLAVVHEALECVEATDERCCEAELHRLRGELLRADGREREAEHSFLRAISVARHQGAGLFELRATVGLSRLLRELGQPEEAERLLARVCARFDTSTDLPDLQEARALRLPPAGP
jgi:predicted ATPase